MKKITAAFFLLSFIIINSSSFSQEINLPGKIELTGSDSSIILAYIRHAENKVNGLDGKEIEKQIKKAPEMLCWVDFKYLDALLSSYLFTENVKYLDLFYSGFEIYRKKLTSGPDNFLGWRGMPIDPLKDPDNPDVIIDEIQTSFRGIAIIAKWVSLVKNNPTANKKYKKQVKEYLNLAEGHLFKKWDARGYWEDMGKHGGIYHWNRYYKPQKRFQTLPHEKHSIMVDGLLKLYHATGEDLYMKRAVKIGAWLKSTLKLKDGHYWWNYWEPGGSWDIDKTKEDAWRHWIDNEPKSMWHNVTLGIAVSLYRHGLVFSEEDIQRFLKTQKEVCWNGDTENPAWFTTKGRQSKEKMLCYDIALFDTLLIKLAYGNKETSVRLSNAGSDWKGCANATQWLELKYIYGPLLNENKDPFARYGQQYLKTKKNKDFIEDLTFHIMGSGYATPMKPSEMKAE